MRGNYTRLLTPSALLIFPVSLALSAGDEGRSGPVSSPGPPQLPLCPPLSDASVLAGRPRGPAGLRLAPLLLGPAHQAPRLSQGGANSVRHQLLASAQNIITMCYLWIFDIFPLFYRSCSQPLLSPTPTDLTAVSTVSDWLKALRMERYQDEFDQAHLDTLDRVSRLNME